MRSIFNKHNGNLATTNSVAFMFEHRGEILTGSLEKSEEEMLELVLDTGAEELLQDGDTFQIYTAPDQLYSVAEALREKGIEPQSQKLVYLPQNTTEVSDAQQASQLLRLLDALEDYDDTLNVYCNFEMDETVLQTAENA
jgi:transcriptional/translational regulatory protein YebC/TACO1